MKRKTFIGIITVFAVLLFGISYSFATNNIGEEAVEGVRNVVGGAENVVEDAASDVASGIRDGITDVKDDTENTANKTTGAMTSDNSGNTGYSATRTATTTTTGNSNTFLGMGATAWGWLIMAIVGIITVALVWYYGKQNETNYNHNDDNY